MMVPTLQRPVSTAEAVRGATPVFHTDGHGNPERLLRCDPPGRWSVGTINPDSAVIPAWF